MRIIIIIIVLGGILAIREAIKDAMYSFVTLTFLPSALDFAYRTDINVYTIKIPIIGSILEPIVNYFVLVFLNIVDFILWILHFIPGFGIFMDFVYRSPDVLEKWFEMKMATNGLHRYFLTHSIFNPIFIIMVLIMLIIVLLNNIKVMPKILNNIVFFVTFIGCIILSCHLFADTLPLGWKGTALIKVVLPFMKITLNGFLSKLWLWVNAILMIYIPSILIAGKSE